MKKDITDFIKKACKRYKLEAMYNPKTDVYMFHKHGRAVQGFNGGQFYEVPRRRRMFELGPLLRVGMHRNLGEDKSMNQILINTKKGKVIK